MQNRTFPFLATAAAVFAGGLAFSAASAPEAKAASIYDCRGDSKRVVTRCCEEYMRNVNRVWWVTSTPGGCSAVTKCVSPRRRLEPVSFVAAPKKPRCKIAQVIINEQPGGGVQNPGNPQQPGPRPVLVRGR